MTRNVSAGYSLVELIFVAGVLTTMAAMAVPAVLISLDDMQTSGAARYIATRLQRTRMEAIARSADVALRFGPSSDGFSFAMYVDGNGNGVRTRDIDAGVDRRVGVVERLAEQFSGVDFGAGVGVPPVDANGQAPGEDPVRLGAGNMASFSARGTATPGSLYIRGRRSSQYVVRLYGDTGKARILKLDRRLNKWTPP